MRSEVIISGALFNGGAKRAVTEYCAELERVVAGQALADAMGIMNASFRHPTPYYEVQIIAQRRIGETVVHDRKIVYGPWLEGVSRRNQLSSFKGYHSFRRATQSVQTKVMRLAYHVLPPFLEADERVNSQALFDAVQSHALASGLFDRVNTHEPKNAPGNQVVCAIYLAGVRPVNTSGLASTSGVVTFVVRVYKSMLAEPQDGIDPEVLAVVDTLFSAYSGDFTLGATVREIDLLGATGTALSANAGYLPFDGGTYRTVDITLPIVLNDLWTQSA